MRVFLGAAVVATLLAAGAAIGASGDLIYSMTGPRVEVSAEAAATIGTWAVTHGAWSGASADIMTVYVHRCEEPSGFCAQVQGHASAAAGSLDWAHSRTVIGVEP